MLSRGYLPSRSSFVTIQSSFLYLPAAQLTASHSLTFKLLLHLSPGRSVLPPGNQNSNSDPTSVLISNSSLSKGQDYKNNLSKTTFKLKTNLITGNTMFNKRNFNSRQDRTSSLININLGFRGRSLTLLPTVTVRGDELPTGGIVHVFYRVRTDSLVGLKSGVELHERTHSR